MSRLKSLLGLLAMLVLSMFVTPSASAAPPPDCTEVSPTQPGWPYAQFTFYCAGASASNAGDMQLAINQSPGFSGKELARAGVVFYLYPTPAAYTTDFGSAALTVGSNDFAETAFDSNNMPLYSVVFQTNKAGATNSFIKNVSGHEAGRAVDALMGYVFNGGVLTLPYPNLSSYASYDYFQNNQNSDWKAFNAISPACASQTGNAGPFSEKQDYTYVTYFCNGSAGQSSGLISTYAGLSSNLAVLEKSWPTTFNSTPQTFAELFTSNLLSATDLSGQGGKDNFVNTTYLPCSAALMVQAVENDTIGLGQNPPAGCSTPASITNCVRVFQQQGNPVNPGNGGIFGCSKDGAANNLATSLNLLGTLRGQNPTAPIQQTLYSGKNIIYVFSLDSYYQTLFGSVLGSAAADTNAGGYTYPASNGIVYSILIETPIQGKGSYGIPVLTENATHEEGHAVDYIKGWTNQSASAGFDAAMQNDFVYLDYDVVNNTNMQKSHKRNPCGSQSMDGYTGPLVGVYDATSPVSGQANTFEPFCTGNVIESKWSTDLTSTILENKDVGTGLFVKDPANETIGVAKYPGGWLEWYAQSFAIQANYDTSGTGGSPVADPVVANGYFACTAGSGGWLASVYAGKGLPNTTACKKANLPTWWTNLS